MPNPVDRAWRMTVANFRAGVTILCYMALEDVTEFFGLD